MKEQFRKLLKENRWLKWIPNSLTLCNSLCGFIAILYTLNVYKYPAAETMDVFESSAWIILFAMVFDALDGFAARIFNAASMHGMQMDSLADMVTFGVAPATVVAIMTHCLRDMTMWQVIMVYALSSVYLGCAALRLATYNVHAMLEKKSSDKFSGLPSPGGAAAICSIVFFFRYFEWPQNHLSMVLPFYAGILGLLMVSKVAYPHMGKWFFSIRRNKKRLAAFVLMLAFVAVFKVIGVVILVNLYIISGPVMGLFNYLRQKKIVS